MQTQESNHDLKQELRYRSIIDIIYDRSYQIIEKKSTNT